MISFNYETDFKLDDETKVSEWISNTISNENCNEGEINYIFCDDDYLHQLNVQFLEHDTLTDIISFDYTLGQQLNGDIYISTERVLDNAETYSVAFEIELCRVMILGVLHYMGYKDKSIEDKNEMRKKENTCLLLYKAN